MIDLGDVSEPETAPRPAVSRRPRGPGWLRRVTAGVAAVAVLGLCAASGTPAAPRLELVYADPVPHKLDRPDSPHDVAILLDGDALYVASKDSVERRDLTRGGQVTWRVPVPPGQNPPRLKAAGGLVLVTGAPEGKPSATVALGADGKERWRAGGEPEHVLSNGYVLFSGSEYAAVEFATGKVLWQSKYGGEYLLDASGQPVWPARLAGLSSTVGLDKYKTELVLRDPASGKELASTVLLSYTAPGSRGSASYGGDLERVLAVPGAVLVQTGGYLRIGDTRFSVPSELRSFGADLTPARPAIPFAEGVHLRRCGRHLCGESGRFGSLAGTERFVLDPATGARLWSSPHDGLISTGGTVLIPASRAWKYYIGDPASPGQLQELPGWRPVVGAAGPRGLPVQRFAADHWLGLLDPGSRSVRVAGKIPARLEEGVASGSYFAGFDDAGVLRVWRLR